MERTRRAAVLNAGDDQTLLVFRVTDSRISQSRRGVPLPFTYTQRAASTHFLLKLLHTHTEKDAAKEEGEGSGRDLNNLSRSLPLLVLYSVPPSPFPVSFKRSDEYCRVAMSEDPEILQRAMGWAEPHQVVYVRCELISPSMVE